MDILLKSVCVTKSKPQFCNTPQNNFQMVSLLVMHIILLSVSPHLYDFVYQNMFLKWRQAGFFMSVMFVINFDSLRFPLNQQKTSRLFHVKVLHIEL